MTTTNTSTGHAAGGRGPAQQRNPSPPPANPEVTATVDDRAREELRHSPEGEPPPRMLMPRGLLILMAVLVGVVAIVSFGLGAMISFEAGLLTAVVGCSLIIFANPALWAALLRVREHDRAKRGARASGTPPQGHTPGLDQPARQRPLR